MKKWLNIRKILDDLAYDFSKFEVEDFVQHVERYQQREIIVNGVAIEREISAMLLRGETVDYIFYNLNLHPVQQTHSLLHEIAHIVLQHPYRRLEEFLSPEMLAKEQTRTAIGHLRVANAQLRQSTEEQEAEAFVMLIQEQLVIVRRLQKLMEPSSSIAAFRPWIDGVWKIGRGHCVSDRCSCRNLACIQYYPGTGNPQETAGR